MLTDNSKENEKQKNTASGDTSSSAHTSIIDASVTS